MVSRHEAMMTLDAEIRVPVAVTRLARFHVTEPADNILCEQDAYWLDLCLTPRPRNARACYVDRWAPYRFERIGDLFVLPPGEPMRIKSDGGSSQASVLCHLRREPLRQWFDGKLPWSDRLREAGLDISDANLRRLLLRLADELRNPGFASEALVELIAGQIGIELFRYCNKVQEPRASGGLAPWRLRRIEERLREVRAAPTLAELASLCNLSVRQLTRAFRASHGYSIGEHVAQRRVDNAKRLLCSDESVKAIAFSLGFSSASSFSFAFRSATGQTPRQFRDALRSSAADVPQGA